MKSSPEPLPAPRLVGHVYITSREKYIHLLLGFVGWYVINGGLWLLIMLSYARQNRPFDPSAYSLNLLCLPVNLAALLILVVQRRWAAFGILIALAVNFAIAIFVGTAVNVLCGIPFFVK